jgi:hypothetical protein
MHHKCESGPLRVRSNVCLAHLENTNQSSDNVSELIIKYYLYVLFVLL